jgi:hypothetical protein
MKSLTELLYLEMQDLRNDRILMHLVLLQTMTHLQCLPHDGRQQFMESRIIGYAVVNATHFLQNHRISRLRTDCTLLDVKNTELIFNRKTVLSVHPQTGVLYSNFHTENGSTYLGH